MEYEYSFNVKNINKYINYCKENNYEFIEENDQCRTIYRNINGTMGRITIKNNTSMFLDFKEDKLSKEILIERKETPCIEFFDLDAIESILSFLEYKKDNTLERNRKVYVKNGVKFEIDSYTKPEVNYVIAIEGIKNEVDIVYEEVKSLYKDVK